jgi:outer membrane protein OmpA-like peptidoglycan-associated protein
MTTGEKARSQSVSRRVRLVRRAAGARLPFVPYGLVPALGLVLLVLLGLTAFARGAVESATARASRQALDAVGAGWATAKVSGQWVTLEGTPPTTADGLKAMNAVYGAKAGTLFGSAIPVTKVTEHFVSASAAPASPPRALAATPAAIARCEQTLADLLGRTRIEFPTASAVIGRDSLGVLDAVAKAAGDCPGVLQIEGHTDSDGAAAPNQALSLRRAEAVRDALVKRGVPAERLTVAGYGAEKPVASNATAEGRNRNRRIEMRVVQPPT